jgi:FG-GAP repeat
VYVSFFILQRQNKVVMATTYQQIGPDINGEAAGDEFGESVSMSADGTIFVVGGAENTGVNGDESGHVRVYKFDSTINSYAQFGLDIDGEAIGDQFGTSVSMSADGAAFVVGARLNNGINGCDSGQARVYKFDSTILKYAQLGLDIDGEAFFDAFGTSVSMSGDGTTFVVGATRNNGIPGIDSGHVRVFSTGIVKSTNTPTKTPTKQPTNIPTKSPTNLPTKSPTKTPTKQPTKVPTKTPTKSPTKTPTTQPTNVLTKSPTKTPTTQPTKFSTKQPTKVATRTPTKVPIMSWTTPPTKVPTYTPTEENCGILGWNFFCPRRGKCGFWKRLWNLGNCD